MNFKKILKLAMIFTLLLSLFTGCKKKDDNINEPVDDPTPTQQVVEDQQYNDLEDVALYIHLYGHLPSNFMTKKEAREIGWSSGPLDKIKEGYSIGGSVFGNNEGLLPEKDGRIYYECDIDTVGQKSRGAKRIVYSNDGLVYYTEDHYSSFTLLYGEE